MSAYELLCVMSLLLTGFAAYSAFIQTHIPAVRRAKTFIQRQKYHSAIRVALSGVGLVPWAWISNTRFMQFVANWITTETELKELAQEAFSHIEAPESDFEVAFNKWLYLIDDAEEVATKSVQMQLGDYNEADWNTLALELAKTKVFLYNHHLKV